MKTVMEILTRIENREVIQITSDEYQAFIRSLETHCVCCEFQVRIEGRFIWLSKEQVKK